MGGVAKALIGIAGPILLVLLVWQGVTWRPDPPPDPAALGEADTTAGGVELVGSPDGTWVATDGSFVGYRVTEHYPQLREPTVGAGRTDEVEATVVVAGRTLAEAEVVGDLRGLRSGHQNRDRAVQSIYIQTDEHPDARFTLDEPLDLAGELQPGRPFEVEATGTLEVRDTARSVTFPLEGRWDGDEVQLAGQIATRLTDWGITPPDIAGFVRVDDDAVIELELQLVRPGT